MKKLSLESLKKNKLTRKSLNTIYGGGIGTDLSNEQRLKVSRQNAN
ncbi:hypothetical protein [Aquimarina sp. MMG016]|nr:hypothetical protein [Aquimarina sp. MMG016]MBQ4818603.1 hypothetical protein [Aquimarina sp. MMG016]